MGKRPILIVGSLSLKGYKITKFLRNNGYTIIGTDRRKNGGRNQANKFMRVDLRNQNNVALLLKLYTPSTIIYCMEEMKDEEQFNVVDYNPVVLQNLLIQMAQNNISEIAVCVENQSDKLDTPKELGEFNLRMLTALFSQKYNWHSKILDKKDNLLRGIKEFVKGGGG